MYKLERCQLSDPRPTADDHDSAGKYSGTGVARYPGGAHIGAWQPAADMADRLVGWGDRPLSAGHG
jgi:hypothetical protein